MIQVEEQSTRPEYSVGVSGNGQGWVRERAGNAGVRRGSMLHVMQTGNRGGTVNKEPPAWVKSILNTHKTSLVI